MSDDQTSDPPPPGSPVARPEPLRGYQVLSDDQRDLVDRIKVTEAELGVIWRRVRELPGHDAHHHAMARDAFMAGFMWLVRSVACPDDVYEQAPDGWGA